MKLKSKIIIVTGGNSGIGLEISKKIVSEGGTVIICARDKNNLISSIKELEKLSNISQYYYQLDVSKLEEVKLFSNWVKKEFDEIHGLVNCAGSHGPIGKTTQIDLIDFLNTINTNLMGVIYMCTTFSELFSSKYKKKIINFSGGGATKSFPNYSAYATSKVAVVRFTENLAIELLDDNFEVNCVAPGFVSTKIHQSTLDAGPDLAGENFYNTQKMLEDSVSPFLAADLTSFLLSEDSNGITGKLISANWDPWKDKSFQNLLKTDKDFATIRRIDNKIYYKK